MRFRLKALPHVFSGPYLNAFMHHKTDSYLLLVYGKCCKLHMYNSWGLLAPLNDENALYELQFGCWTELLRRSQSFSNPRFEKRLWLE